MAISLKPWIDLFEPFFGDSTTEVLVAAGVGSRSGGPAKAILQQTRRLVTIADDIQTVRKGRDALPLFFLLICAESVSKTHSGFSGEGESRRHVRRFFLELLPEPFNAIMGKLFTDAKGHPVPVATVLDVLYDVRCSLAHEGRYWDFALAVDSKPSQLACEPPLLCYATLPHIRGLILLGAATAAADLLGVPARLSNWRLQLPGRAPNVVPIRSAPRRRAARN